MPLIHNDLPAFPKADTVESTAVYAGDSPRIIDGHDGMNVLTWLAGKAMQGMLANALTRDGVDYEIEVAKRSVDYAQAVIVEIHRRQLAQRRADENTFREED
jgi:hypothetical protein